MIFTRTLAPPLTNLKAHPILAMRPGHCERRNEIPHFHRFDPLPDSLNKTSCVHHIETPINGGITHV
ncbi:MAG TPA: hypothetical protein VED37_14560 [Ktedonobacteraceae bacterium]|nr:hypothetical protein [Ktedonobacteraceae bacterium]